MLNKFEQTTYSNGYYPKRIDDRIAYDELVRSQYAQDLPGVPKTQSKPVPSRDICLCSETSWRTLVYEGNNTYSCVDCGTNIVDGVAQL